MPEAFSSPSQAATLVLRYRHWITDSPRFYVATEVRKQSH